MNASVSRVFNLCGLCEYVLLVATAALAARSVMVTETSVLGAADEPSEVSDDPNP